jgi:hypothetical protein
MGATAMNGSRQSWPDNNVTGKEGWKMEYNKNKKKRGKKRRKEKRGRFQNKYPAVQPMILGYTGQFICFIAFIVRTGLNAYPNYHHQHLALLHVKETHDVYPLIGAKSSSLLTVTIVPSSFKSCPRGIHGV